jgi:hypothetical protein
MFDSFSTQKSGYSSMFHYRFLLLFSFIGAMAACSPATFAQSQYGGGFSEMMANKESNGVQLLATRKKRVDRVALAPLAVIQGHLPDAEITEALRKTVDCEFVDTPLKDAMDFVAEQLGYPVFIDEQSLAEVGLGVDETVNLSVKNFQLEHLLTQMLSQLGITHMVIDGNVKITTLERVESNLQTCVYPVGDLFPSSSASHDAVMALLTSVVEPDSWQDVGGAGTIDSLNSSLIISQNYKVHQQLEHLLDVFRELRDDTSSRKQLPVFYGSGAALDKQAIRAALRHEIRLPESQMTLNEFAGFLSEATKENVLVDQRGLEDIGLSVVQTALFQTGLSNMSARRALDSLGGGLGWQIHAGAVVITSKEGVESLLDTRVYPVTQLISGNRSRSPGNATDLDHLVEVIMSNVAPDSWEDVGGAGMIVRIMEPPAMVIVQDDRTHSQIVSLLSTINGISRHEQKSTPHSASPSSSQTLLTVVYERPVPASSKMEPITAIELAETIQKLLGIKNVARRGCMIHVVDDRVVVRQTAAKHHQIVDLLQLLYPNYGIRGVGRSGGFF